MKVSENIHNVKTEGLEDSIQWSVTESSFLFDLLGTKLYKNPQKAVCREYFTNALDANIEANRKNKPIEVHLPTNTISYLVVKDVGVGISPERATEIYTRLGESTKRDSNKQHGAMGLGRVSFCAVSDQMTVETNYNGRKYIYVVYKGKNGIPFLTSDNYEGVETDEVSGTKITIPIKRNDISQVASEGLKLFRFFPVQPICNLKLPESKPLYSNDIYTLDDNETSYYHNMYAVMGSIVYPIDSTYASDLCNGYDLYLHFKIGEISVEASREGLHYDEKTKKRIKERFEEFQKDIKERIAKEYENLQGWDLYCKKNEVHDRFKGLVDCSMKLTSTKECGSIYRFNSHKYRLDEFVELEVRPTTQIQWFVRDKEDRFVKPLRDWFDENHRSPRIVEPDKLIEIKKVFGLQDSHFKYTSEFKTVKTGKSRSVRGVTRLYESGVKANCFKIIEGEVEVKYYVVRKGLDILYNNNTYSTSYLLTHIIEHKTPSDWSVTYNGEPVYAVLPSQLKSLPDDAVEVVEDSIKKLRKSLTDDDLLAIVQAQKIQCDTYVYRKWDVKVLRDAADEVIKIRDRASKANDVKNALAMMGDTFKLPEWKGTFKYEAIEKTPSILKYVSYPSDKNHRVMIEKILSNQLRKVKV